MPDLPRVYNPGYAQARKQPNGQYKLFWRGTNNEIFYGELFRTPQEAKSYLHAMIIKNNQKEE
jgi:hypothetical protein